MEIDLDPLAKKALEAIYRERDRLGAEDKAKRAFLGDKVVIHLPKRNIKQKLQKVLSSPSRSQLVLNLVSTFIGRVKFLAYLRVIFTFPAQITRLQQQLETLEFQLADQKVKLLKLAKSLEKN